MTKKEKERTKYCLLAKCKYYRSCQVKWGKDCVRQQGSKIPRLKWQETNYLVITGAPGEKLKVRKRRAGDPYYG
ncbi:hypothetical protein [Thermoanaerobacterium sp. DL9XJH110]|uniref:hypothetical protein n=1 Tax=Thermoanaerobacterium sp. DL9XJH110 TaxID=3386643 RepID=UPI003BB6301E